jgi:hypothetical protein
MLRGWGLALLLPFLVGFDGAGARRALEAALHNLHGADMFAGIEIEIDDGQSQQSWVQFGYGRKRTDDETKTLVYVSDGPRRFSGALLFQRSGERDRIFLTEGKYGHVRPLSAGRYDWGFFGSDFSYDDFRAHEADEYRIEVLGEDTLQGEPCRVLRLRPLEGPYTVIVAWLSTKRPLIVRTDLFDEQGLWKRKVVRLSRVVRNFEWWVPMEEEMMNLRTGSRSVRRIRNILVDVEVPDEVFSVTHLTRGHVPSF